MPPLERTLDGGPATRLANNFAINLRTLSAPKSGVQRYAEAVATRYKSHARLIQPHRAGQGIYGHMWEQFELPRQLRGALLFSPANTGPLAYRRQVVTIHDAATFDQAGAFTGLFGRWYRWLLPRLARRCLGIVTVSAFSKERLVAKLGIPESKIAVVHNGVTAPPSDLLPAELARIAARLHLPHRFLLFVGSLDPRKNLSRLVQAFSDPHFSDLHLIVAGGANQSLFADGQFSAQAQERVRFLGHVDENILETLYARAEGFVFPSIYEGFGLPPLEAMARGCPVLCSNSTSMPEVCGPDVRDGGAVLYFSPHSTEAIGHALRSFYAIPAAQKQTMAQLGRAQAEKFTWDRCAQQTWDAIDAFGRGFGAADSASSSDLAFNPR